MPGSTRCRALLESIESIEAELAEVGEGAADADPRSLEPAVPVDESV